MRSRHDRLMKELCETDGWIIMAVAIAIVAITLPHLIN